MHTDKNVGWLLTRHHNIKQAAKILFLEYQALRDAGLMETADELLRLSGKADSINEQLECIRIVLPEVREKESD